MITTKQVEETISRIYKEAVIHLPEDVKQALKDAYENEDDKTARLNLKTVLDNIDAASEDDIPMCQDTGLPIVFVKLGKVEVENLYEGIRNGVERATKEVPLRPNVVDPLTRENTGSNVGKDIPQINVELIDGDYLELTVFPKGFGSENNNALKMALPGESVEGIKKFVLETVNNAGGKPCPPTIIGVGIGGSSDMVMKLAKKALLRSVGEHNPDPRLAELEDELLELVNATGIGPMGLGGKTTALDVKVELADTHTAGLPIGVCIQCWAGRHASAILRP
ncbi:fumarate hydratase [Methanobacterium paludis]|uniref:Hydro-lyase, Fe-S type, tartrate/fumarate subfamily, alpha subunit n=1 Tax=Methanobacterium paludis (strain DSM 25820 / JCM 18151 / SWAN1) TaxID=868131 RepID=F6D699_METPW|nr:fumarate hydratase [Methanobacterium paludis]AEG18920.1 hydro-lyase, Fe-S type, tartrate/fumarate subfamily, alpha subunit [Methanobacterium paludis]